MTIEEAKDYIREWCPYDRQEEIIKALEQEPCEDCVNREEVHNLIIPWLNDYLLDETREVLETIDYKVGDLPPVTPQYTEAEIQKMQELEQAEIQKAYELGKAEQPCEDCISRQAVIDWLTDRTEKYDEKGHFISKELVKAEVKNWLAELPSVTPVNVYAKGYKDAMEIHEKLKVEHKGKWMVVEHNCGYVQCSICNKRVPFCKRSNFCPNCGAKMQEVEE